MQEKISVRFDGGIAAQGQLHYYEFSRSQYALARFISTIEHFRRTGLIAEKIRGGSYVELLVSAPKQGSFLQDILIESFKDGGAEVISTSFIALAAFLWHYMVPRRERTDKALIDLAKIQLAIEHERTIQQKEHTEQLSVLRAIADGQRASSSDAVELLKWSLEKDKLFPQAFELSGAQRVDMLSEVQAENERERSFRKFERALENIAEHDLNALTSRLRSMVYDMGLPLRRSATQMSLGEQAESSKPVAYITPEIVALINARTPEEELTRIRGRVKAYDRDSGVGKVLSGDLPRVLNFVVPQALKKDLRDLILAAMQRNTVTLVCRRVLDESNLPTSLILVDLQMDNDLEQGDEL